MPDLSSRISQFAHRCLPAPIAQYLRRQYIRLQRSRNTRAIQNFERKIVRHSYGGIELDVVIADHTAADWYDADWPLLPEIELLATRKLRPGARVFDLGAHQGIVASLLASKVGPDGEVIAVEPNPHNVSILRENLAINNIHNVTVVHAAVSDTSGTCLINHRLNTRLSDVQSKDDGLYEVNSVTIDGLAERYGQPNVIFIDVEGHEVSVVAGGCQTLRSTPDCFVEVHVGMGLEQAGGRISDIFDALESKVYDHYISYHDAQPFIRLEPDMPLPTHRFFLIALER